DDSPFSPDHGQKSTDIGLIILLETDKEPAWHQIKLTTPKCAWTSGFGRRAFLKPGLWPRKPSRAAKSATTALAPSPARLSKSAPNSVSATAGRSGWSPCRRFRNSAGAHRKPNNFMLSQRKANNAGSKNPGSANST